MIFEDKVMSAKFGRNSIFVSRLYSQFIKDVKITDLRKITIEVVDNPASNHVIAPHKLIKVCMISKYFDLRLLEINNNQKEVQRLILNWIFECVTELAQKLDWPLEQFEFAYNKVIELDFKNEFVLVPKKPSKDKQYSASVIVKCLLEQSTIILELSGTKVKSIELLNVVYYKDDFSDIVYTLKWLNKDELIVCNKKEDICFKYNIEKDELEMNLIPKTNDLEYLKDELELINPNTTKEQHEKIIAKRLLKYNPS